MERKRSLCLFAKLLGVDALSATASTHMWAAVGM